MTIDAMDLNNHDKVVLKRFEIGELLNEAIKTAIDRLDAYKCTGSTRDKNRITSQVSSILIECLEDKEYAATASTIVCNDPDFIALKSAMKNINLWDEEMEFMYSEIEYISLLIV